VASANSSAALAKTHTIRFKSVTLKQHNFSKTSFGETGKDVRHGTIVGFDTINGKFHPKTRSANGAVAFSTKGGMLIGKLTFSNGPITTGRVTGGTGKFKNATGTIKGTNLNKSGTRTAVVIVWS
jgi:hypothetical protein